MLVLAGAGAAVALRGTVQAAVSYTYTADRVSLYRGDGTTATSRQPEQFVGTIAERLLMYAIGRNLQYYDAPTVRTVMRDAAPANYTLPSLVLGIVKSRPFQMREAGGE